MEIKTLSPHSSKIITMGMSCVGKTTLARKLKELDKRTYHSFDSEFHYRLVGLPGYSPKKNWERILTACQSEKWVLDNWTTEDYLGEVISKLAPDAVIYVVYDEHQKILDRYRVPVSSPDGFISMYNKMYKQVDFESYKVPVRSFRADGKDYWETTLEEMRNFMGGRS